MTSPPSTRTARTGLAVTAAGALLFFLTPHQMRIYTGLTLITCWALWRIRPSPTRIAKAALDGIARVIVALLIFIAVILAITTATYVVVAVL
jgi:hypothetical protein